ncbi:hypothetical protein RvY_10922-3 [Ramazzottius varieornatus]|uniref:Uncharacterized protein n=1 Tax=Ramazzottius varieornatus TaxID=947166 RepID=A0A1D1VNB1_RAMVA|nr:hypothetical protein RvY_10922-3 [Ramazzottius varieornatus]
MHSGRSIHLTFCADVDRSPDYAQQIWSRLQQRFEFASEVWPFPLAQTKWLIEALKDLGKCGDLVCVVRQRDQQFLKYPGAARMKLRKSGYRSDATWDGRQLDKSSCEMDLNDGGLVASLE